MQVSQANTQPAREEREKVTTATVAPQPKTFISLGALGLLPDPNLREMWNLLRYIHQTHLKYSRQPVIRHIYWFGKVYQEDVVHAIIVNGEADMQQGKVPELVVSVVAILIYITFTNDWRHTWISPRDQLFLRKVFLPALELHIDGKAPNGQMYGFGPNQSAQLHHAHLDHFVASLQDAYFLGYAEKVCNAKV